MPVQTLFKAKALEPGSELWVLPEASKSPMAQRIDWYLNFQLARARFHESQTLSPELKSTLIQQEWPEFSYKQSEGAPLMVAAQGLLPTQMVVMLPERTKHQEWVKSIEDLWSQLGRPSLRVFMPESLSTDDFRNLWQKNQSNANLSLVPH